MSWWAAGAAIGGALIGSAASRSASSQQADANAAALAQNQAQSDRNYADLAPYRAAGTQALGQLQSEMDAPVTSADVMNGDPGYQFGLNQGQQAIDRKAAAAGGRVSGASLKAAAEYGTNYATTGYNAAYQRRQDRLNRLASLAGIGQTATGTGISAGTTLATNSSGLTSSLGNAQGAATMAQGNIWGNAANQLGAVGQKWATGGGNTNQSFLNANPDLSQVDLYKAF